MHAVSKHSMCMCMYKNHPDGTFPLKPRLRRSMIFESDPTTGSAGRGQRRLIRTYIKKSQLSSDRSHQLSHFCPSSMNHVCLVIHSRILPHIISQS